MEKILKDICYFSCTSSNEEEIKEYITKMAINNNNKYFEDNLKNLIIINKNSKINNNQIMITANLDEPGLMVTKITKEGALLFSPVGNVKTNSLPSSIVSLNNELDGIIGVKPVHLQTEEEKNKFQKPENLFIDIGCDNKEQAEKFVKIGNIFNFKSDFKQNFNNNFQSRSLGDKFCCSVLIKLLNDSLNNNFAATFLVKEKAGLNCAKTVSYLLKPKIAIVLKPLFINEIKNINFNDEIVVPIYDSVIKYDNDIINLAEQTANLHQIPFKKIILDNPIYTAKNIIESVSGIKTLPVFFICKNFNQVQTAKKQVMLNYFNFINYFMKQLIIN